MAAWLQLGFTSPWLLAALALLPAIWWLLRLTPPQPQRVVFPPTRLLTEIAQTETPARSPWWLTLLRLTLAAAVIIALSGPIWRPDAILPAGNGSIWILIDNGYSAAPSWPTRLATANRLIDQADAAGQPVLIAATADGPGQGFAPMSPDQAIDRLRAIEPRPYPAGRSDLLAKLQAAAATTPPTAIYWLSEPLDHGNGESFAKDLSKIASGAALTVFTGVADTLGLSGVSNGIKEMTIEAIRADGTGKRSELVRASDLKGRTIGQTSLDFGDGKSTATATIALPAELRNDIARLEIIGADHAGAVQLVDDRWRRRAVGLLSGASSDLAQPLLSPLHYISQAMSPFADVIEPRTADLDQSVRTLISQGVAVIIMADIGTLAGDSTELLDEWVTKGGVLVRFAGSRLAAAADALVPVKLRTGGRILGGSLTWNEPQPLASFSETGAFAGLTVPGDVTVTRQVLAEPDALLPDKTWASLGDGTPLVTAGSHGRGTIVLFHVTADTTWSNLPISVAFVEMLRRVTALGSAGAVGASSKFGKAATLLPALRLLDANGHFVGARADAKAVAIKDFQDTRAGPEHPPGYYGTSDGMLALNLLRSGETLKALAADKLAELGQVRAYVQDGPTDLRPWLFGLALALLLIDGVIIIFLSGGLPRRARALSVLVLAAGMLVDLGPAAAADDKAMAAVLSTRLAYVMTGNAEIDETSRMGLSGLTLMLRQRTALEPGEPIGIDISKDELSFFPMIYWPIDPNTQAPPARVMARIDGFMKNGGTVLFDTRDQLNSFSALPGSTGPATVRLREILRGLNIPPLEPVPGDHVLTKAFYLLQDFPGRWAGSPLWVEALPQATSKIDRPVRASDGVSPIMITANDLAGAWAITDTGHFAFPTVPSDPHQRELAFRVGVNIVMYTLTGNYKADQVHVPALLERLGQ